MSAKPLIMSDDCELDQLRAEVRRLKEDNESYVAQLRIAVDQRDEAQRMLIQSQIDLLKIHQPQGPNCGLQMFIE